MASSIRRLELQLRAHQVADPDRIDYLTQKLREQLLELNLQDARPSQTFEIPSGTRAVEAETVGALAIGLACTPELLSAVVNTIQTWLSRVRSSSIKMELDGDSIELTGTPSPEQQKLIQLWIDRHTGR